MNRTFFLCIICCFCLNAFAKNLSLPTRDESTLSGDALAESIQNLPFYEREERISLEFLAGNVPTFFRQFCPVSITNITNGKTNIATFFVAPDYLTIGSDINYFLAPLTPFTAQKIADSLDCCLPTRKMVDAIYSTALLQLSPSPLPPTSNMITVPVFKKHNAIVRQQRFAVTKEFPLGKLTAGHKKDVVLSSRLKTAPGKVAIYGWHQTNRTPIQPLYLGHTAAWVDYSHGIRLVQNTLVVNGIAKSISEVLADPELADLLSDEGVIIPSKYIFEEFPASKLVSKKLPETKNAIPGQFQKSSSSNEQIMILPLERGVRVVINAPTKEELNKAKPLKLIFYGLPNGNTIEQTFGKKTNPGDDWHFNIQHIGAQTRFLREQLTNENIVVAFLENSLKTWPAWRKQFGDQAILQIVKSVTQRFEAFEPKIILTGHSGGGSFTFGYLNCVEKIPDDIERIAFLDSNYGYETALHRDKLIRWLKNSDKHSLTVLAYHDSVALLNGKTFVSAEGGTWGRSHLMKNDFEPQFKFAEQISDDFKKYSALEGRLQFLLKENPEKKILHTVQVERNGFIHAMLTGTPLENRGYDYFGDRAYEQWIDAGD